MRVKRPSGRGGVSKHFATTRGSAIPGPGFSIFASRKRCRSSNFQDSVTPESGRRLDFGGLRGGEQRPEDRDRRDCQGRTGERERIIRLNSKEQVPDEGTQTERDGNTTGNANEQEGPYAAHDAPGGLRGAGADRDPDADLPLPLCH